MRGTYCLLIDVKKDSLIEIGALKKVFFKKGSYVYVGSAMNSLEKRIQRHFSKEKKLHWHIDYLLANQNVEIKKAYIKESAKKEECIIAKKIALLGKPVEGFGCSDCSCGSHLFKVNKANFLTKLNGFKKRNFK